MKNKELRLPLDEVLAERFQVVKEHTGMQANRSVLAFLISHAYDKIQETRYRKLFIKNDVYDMIEKEAAAQEKSVDVYVWELFDREIRKSKEGAKHAEN